MRRLSIGFGEHRHGLHPQLGPRSKHSNRDLSAVRAQNLRKPALRSQNALQARSSVRDVHGALTSLRDDPLARRGARSLRRRFVARRRRRDVARVSTVPSHRPSARARARVHGRHRVRRARASSRGARNASSSRDVASMVVRPPFRPDRGGGAARRADGVRHRARGRRRRCARVHVRARRVEDGRARARVRAGGAMVQAPRSGSGSKGFPRAARGRRRTGERERACCSKLHDDGYTRYNSVQNGERESRGIGEGRSRGSGVAAASEERWTISPHRTHGADFFVRTLRSSDDF